MQFLVFFLLIAFLPQAKANPNFDQEIRAIRKVIAPLLSPVDQSFRREMKRKDIKKKLDLQLAKKIDAKLPPESWACRLSPHEIQKVLFAKIAFVKNFRFTSTCDVNGSVEIKENDPVLRVDLTLKNSAQIFRARYFVRFETTDLGADKGHKVEAKFFDGELYSAEDRNTPYAEFLGDYSFLMKEGHGTDIGGNIYLKKINGRKIDRIFSISLAN